MKRPTPRASKAGQGATELEMALLCILLLVQAFGLLAGHVDAVKPSATFNASNSASRRRQLRDCPTAYTAVFDSACGRARQAGAGNCLICLNKRDSLHMGGDDDYMYAFYKQACQPAFTSWCHGGALPPPPPPPPCDCSCSYVWPCGGCGGGCACLGVGFCNCPSLHDPRICVNISDCKALAAASITPGTRGTSSSLRCV